MKTNQTWLGLGIILLGLLLLAGNLLNINIWLFLWPLALIGVGFWLIVRPNSGDANTIITQSFIGDINRDGHLEISDETFSMFVGDIDLDLRDGQFPYGTTTLTFSSFVSDIDLHVPKDIGVALHSSSFINDIHLRKESTTAFFFNSKKIKSANYPTADRRLDVHVSGFVTDIDIK